MLRITIQKAKDLRSAAVDLLTRRKPGQSGLTREIKFNLTRRSHHPNQKPSVLFRATTSVSALRHNGRGLVSSLNLLCQRSGYRCYATDTKDHEASIKEEKLSYKTKTPRRWSTEDVLEWAKTELKLHAEDLAALERYRSNGSQLLKATEQNLIDAGVAGGSAGILLDKLRIASAPAICELLPRDAAEFQYLTNEETMRASINTFKPLPQLGGIVKVKGYLSSTHIFITEERFKLWKMYFDHHSNTQSTEILVPLGPHGIGKSGIGYLIALTAYFLKKPLFYYPNCRSVITKKNMENVLLLWNKDLMETNQRLAETLEILQTDTTPGASEFWLAFAAIPGAVILFDEHNELYRIPDYSNSWYSIYTSFQTFQGANFVAFIGSAHSKFENSIPDGFKKSVKYLQPLTFTEVKHFITAPNSPLNDFPWEKLPGETQDAKLKKLYSAVGGVYRLLLELHAHLKSGLLFDSFVNPLKANYSNRLAQSEKEFIGPDQEKFLALLKSIANHSAHGVAMEAKETSAIYDRGMLYVKGDSLFPVNDTAFAVIKSKALGNHPHVNSAPNESARGHSLEEQIIDALKKRRERIIKSYTLGYNVTANNKRTKNTTKIPCTQIAVNPDTIEYVPDDDNWDLSQRSSTLIVPKSAAHRTWDFMIKHPKQLCFFQVTVAVSSTALREKFKQFKEFIRGSRGTKQKPVTRFSVYAKMIYGSDARVEETNEGWFILVAGEKIPVNFFICHGIEEERSWTAWSSIYASDPNWATLKIITKECLEEQFDVTF